MTACFTCKRLAAYDYTHRHFEYDLAVQGR